ncbi:amino acid ABC transporter substrate-binding protein [Streptococcus moroccensis]|uniref:Polar amino acid transport system substrate-binding protein n=1 Tax=Streptococcus moroccensis TaxID=1451356 RepID=A0ABT9YSF5_9STRE|nr:amino acid ABC transporter substrate-binding protein [Streptococcus moroccensis]MDQ0222923.1 polar amino acid transport system substrate-binding protein [Streptococcus moroccensis]
MKKIVKAAASLVAIIGLAACGTKASNDAQTDSWEQIEQAGKITIGFDNTFVPMGYEDTSGENVGFDIDLATAVFDKYGVSIEWQPIDWDLKETELNNGNIDLIWNGYTATDARRELVLFTEHYMANEQVLVTKKSLGITNTEGMTDKVLGAQAGSSGYQVFTDEASVLKELVATNDANQYATFNEALIDLKNERIDGLLIDRVYANYYLAQEGILDDYNVIVPGYTSEAFAVGARKADKTLVDKINQALKELYTDGTFGEISDKWFGEDVAADDIK